MEACGKLTMGDAAKTLGLTKARISQLASQGVLEVSMVGGRKMVSAESVTKYSDASRGRGSGRKVFSSTATQLVLMCAEYEVASIVYDSSSEHPLEVTEVLEAARMPFGTVTRGGLARKREFNAWWEHRSVPNTRPGLLFKMPELDARQNWEIPIRSLGMSLSDCYWVCPQGRDDLKWAKLNYFENDFEGACDEGWDEWLANVGLDSPDNTSEGELPKRWAIRDGVRVLLKGCGADDQRPCNEAVATALYRHLLGAGEFVPYEVVQAGGGLACACPDFLGSREEYVPAAYVKDAMGATRGASTYDRFCRYAGLYGCGDVRVREALSKMIVCDSLIANSDRHWRNFGFIRNIDTLEIRPAPLFDSGNCLWYEKTPAQVAAGDWSFAAKPFGPDPAANLAQVDMVSWFNPDKLADFVDEAMAILSASFHATQPGRLSYIEQGLQKRIRTVSDVMAVLAYRV